MNNLIINDYIATNHFAINNSEFRSVINIFNYYGFAFKEAKPIETDSMVYIHFYDEEGNYKKIIKKEIKTGESLHIDTNLECPNFRGLISTHMVPNGKMKRISYKEGTIQRSISTSYFVMYERFNKFRDFSHELYPVSSNIDKMESEWMTMIYLRDNLESSIIIMNKCPNQKGENFKSALTIELYDNKFSFIKSIENLQLNPGGSKIIDISDVIKDSTNKNLFSKLENIIVKVKGKNIEQPMSFNYHSSGDFNIHHF